LFCKKIIVAKSKEVKTVWSNSRHITGIRQVWEKLLRRAMAQNDDDDVDHEMLNRLRLRQEKTTMSKFKLVH
jgi:hypothetical protein